jgi:putative flippase GtrA
VHVVLIPSYEPDARLIELVLALRTDDAATPVVVVDDGSGPRFAPIFEEVARHGARVLHHPRNLGKGAALKTGIRHVLDAHPGAGVVTADGDGQHTPVDVARVAAVLESTSSSLVLGIRAFSGRVPARSRIGNTISRALFRAVSGQSIGDTQTGLRGLPSASLPWLLTVTGERFEYEFRMLLHAPSAGFSLREHPIATVYTEGNASSHFRPVADSARVYVPLLRFAASALVAFAVDTVALLVLQALTGTLLLSIVGARLISASVNFAANRHAVFARGRDVTLRTAIARYASLAVLLLAANFGMLTALTDAGVPLLAAKALTDGSLFAVSFGVQRAVVFRPESSRTTGNPTGGAQRIPLEQALRE